MSHLVDHLTSGLSVADVPPPGVRESRYGGADEDTQFAPPAVCHNGHPFVPGEDVDMAAEGRQSDPRWCNTCGECPPPPVAPADVIRGVAVRIAHLGRRLIGSHEQRLYYADADGWLRQLADATEAGHPQGLDLPSPLKRAVKRADLHDVVLSALAHHDTCTGGDCNCDVDTDLVENTARDVVTGVVGVLRSAGVRVEERVGDAWDVAPSARDSEPRDDLPSCRVTGECGCPPEAAMACHDEYGAGADREPILEDVVIDADGMQHIARCDLQDAHAGVSCDAYMVARYPMGAGIATNLRGPEGQPADPSGVPF